VEAVAGAPTHPDRRAVGIEGVLGDEPGELEIDFVVPENRLDGRGDRQRHGEGEKTERRQPPPGLLPIAVSRR
jgi:hypothetical protein